MYFPTLPEDETEKFREVMGMALFITPEDMPKLFEYVATLPDLDNILVIRACHDTLRRDLDIYYPWVEWYKAHRDYFAPDENGKDTAKNLAWRRVMEAYDKFKKGELS